MEIHKTNLSDIFFSESLKFWCNSLHQVCCFIQLLHNTNQHSEAHKNDLENGINNEWNESFHSNNMPLTSSCFLVYYFLLTKTYALQWRATTPPNHWALLSRCWLY